MNRNPGKKIVLGHLLYQGKPIAVVEQTENGIHVMPVGPVDSFDLTPCEWANWLKEPDMEVKWKPALSPDSAKHGEPAAQVLAEARV